VPRRPSGKKRRLRPDTGDGCASAKLFDGVSERCRLKRDHKGDHVDIFNRSWKNR